MTFITQYLEQMLRLRKTCKPTLPEGHNYHGLEDYVLDRGIEFASAALSRDEHAIVKAAMLQSVDRSFAPKQCFYNSQLLAIADMTRTLVYHEGFAVAGLIPVHHGWCVINDKVVDLTWRDASTGKKVLGVFGPEWGYKGVALDTDALSVEIAQTAMVKSRLDDFERGFPAFKEPRAVR